MHGGEEKVVDAPYTVTYFALTFFYLLLAEIWECENAESFHLRGFWPAAAAATESILQPGHSLHTACTCGH